MSIPLDRLYHYIESVAQDVYGDTVIYHFYPHGSKKIEDLNPISNIQELKLLLNPQIFCNDQEPLDFEMYQNFIHYRSGGELLDQKTQHLVKLNLRKNIYNIFDQCVLLHSEKNSTELDKYINLGFVPAYYWSHGLIALDWFRYAKHITLSKQNNPYMFLIYNRAWSGTREYRLKFAEHLVKDNLLDQCNTSLKFNDNLEHYSVHQYKKSQWKPTIKLENYFTENQTTSCYSADFNLDGYQSSHCEVVLETLFDTERIHLTEKTLRPIAMGQPFLLCGPPGSLQYLRNYGFKTFNGIVDESYDSITSPTERLKSVLKVMKTMSAWNEAEKRDNLYQMQLIADFNKNYFFSLNFFNILTNELKNNLKHAIHQVISSNTFNRCINLNQTLQNNEQYVKWFNTYPHLQEEHINAINDAYNIAIQLKTSINN